jgi:hypothetical protein
MTFDPYQTGMEKWDIRDLKIKFELEIMYRKND